MGDRVERIGGNGGSHTRTWVVLPVAVSPRLEAFGEGGAQPDVVDDAGDDGGAASDWWRLPAVRRPLSQESLVSVERRGWSGVFDFFGGPYAALSPSPSLVSSSFSPAQSRLQEPALGGAGQPASPPQWPGGAFPCNAGQEAPVVDASSFSATTATEEGGHVLDQARGQEEQGVVRHRRLLLLQLLPVVVECLYV